MLGSLPDSNEQGENKVHVTYDIGAPVSNAFWEVDINFRVDHMGKGRAETVSTKNKRFRRFFNFLDIVC